MFRCRRTVVRELKSYGLTDPGSPAEGRGRPRTCLDDSRSLRFAHVFLPYSSSSVPSRPSRRDDSSQRRFVVRAVATLVQAVGLLFILVGGGGGVVGVSAAQAQSQAQLQAGTARMVGTGRTAPVQPDRYSEAPSLAKRVEAGTLPPVRERLPEEPLVVEPADRPGQYGGTWTYGMLSSGQFPVLYRNLGWEHLVRWGPDYLEIKPNLARAVDVGPDAKEYIFYLRKGLRWSDGAPFTAEDLTFYYNHIVKNEQLRAISAVFTWGGEPLTIEEIDTHTVRIVLPESDGLFLRRLAGPYGSFLTRFPAHYLKQFHPSYNPNVDSLVAASDVSSWVELFTDKAPVVPFLRTWAMKPDLPTMNAWTLETAYGEGTRVVARRNPYYWKVDPTGQQLPYLDRVVHRLFGNQETILLRTLNGDLPFQWNNVNSQVNKSVLYDARERGDYRFVALKRAQANQVSMSLNLTHPDSVKQALFNKKDFRIGLSHAINRQEIIDLVYMGQGTPRQVAPMPGSPLYNERMAQQYVEYDVEKAQRYLDAAGLSERDRRGFRRAPNGERLTLVLELVDVGERRYPEVAELLRHYWREVGIDAHIRIHNRDYFFIRRLQNEADAYLWKAPGGRGSDVIMDPKLYLPFTRGSYPFVPWGLWMESDGVAQGARRPEGPAWRQVQLYNELRAAPTAEQQRALMRKILDISAEQFYTIGVGSRTGGYAVVKTNFHNVPNPMNYAWKLGTPAAYTPAQFFIAPPAQTTVNR
jgi:ABC-type transport system substrate-binding protein